MKISARNTFRGTITAIQLGAVNAEVDIDLGNGDRLVAIVTMDSLQALELAPGREVLALVKASWVMVMTDAAVSAKLSARNCLSGTVRSVDVGAVNAEVCITLAGGTEVIAVITRDAVQDLGLKPGATATAVIKASHVVLGVPT